MALQGDCGAALKRCRADRPLFDELLLPQIEKFMHEAKRATGLALTCLVSHGLRHGGPSHDTLHNTRTLEQIQLRGRWRAFESVRRYMKHGLLLKVTAQLSSADLRSASVITHTFADDFVSALRQWPQSASVQRPLNKTVVPDFNVFSAATSAHSLRICLTPSLPAQQPTCPGIGVWVVAAGPFRNVFADDPLLCSSRAR